MVATLAELRDECCSSIDPAYAAKYLHKIPAAPVVDRVAYLVEHCRAKRVLSLGASGPLESQLREVTTAHYSVDRVAQDAYTLVIDLDVEPSRLASLTGQVDLVVAGEIIEHLSNPGRLLDAVRQLRVPVIVTAPNANSSVGAHWLHKSLENVNDEHVAYYSYKTLHTLLQRHGFTVRQFAWYKGQPIWAEGLVFYAE